MAVPACALLLHWVVGFWMDMQQRRDTRKLQRLENTQKTMLKELKVRDVCAGGHAVLTQQCGGCVVFRCASVMLGWCRQLVYRERIHSNANKQHGQDIQDKSQSDCVSGAPE